MSVYVDSFRCLKQVQRWFLLFKGSGEFEICSKKELGLNNEYHERKAFYVKIKSDA